MQDAWLEKFPPILKGSTNYFQGGKNVLILWMTKMAGILEFVAQEDRN